MKIKFIIMTATVTLFCVVSSARAGLIVNGDFETGTFSPWVVNPGAGGDTIGVDGVPAFGGGTTAADGNFIAGFNGGQTNPGGTLSQTFATVAGVQYVVRYDVGATGNGNQTLLASILGNDGITVLNSLLSAGVNPPVTPASYSFSFTGDGAQATIQFFDSLTNNSINQDVLLDNVSVTALPEPSSLVALAGLSLAGLFKVARRRRKA